MQDAVSSIVSAPADSSPARGMLARVAALSIVDWAAAIATAILLIASFPNFDFWPLAWVALTPLLIAIARKPVPLRAFLLGWLAGAVFFYGSCHWLTFSMVHYGGIPQWFAYLLLLPAPMIGGLFVGASGYVLARSIRKWGMGALFLAPVFWPALEWARLLLIGQLWNAIGYSQAFQPALIQSARWGGVYLVGFLIVSANAAVAYVLLKRSLRALAISGCVIALVATLILVSDWESRPGTGSSNQPGIAVVALQPNVPMTLVKSNQEIDALMNRHVSMSEEALRQLPKNEQPRLVIWPESPMYFTYGSDARLRDLLTQFATENQTSLILNSQEAAPNEGIYNSAVMVNQQGRLIAQYDKIRLMPFGEYVPLPRWVPGASSVGAIIGDFTPGSNYTLMNVDATKAGVFICIEAAYPNIARGLTQQGADVLINISNDGYLGPTAVMRQHLSNAVFRAVENGLPILRVTNSGISAYITRNGEVRDATNGFETDVRVWSIGPTDNAATFYSRRGDVFPAIASVLSILVFAGSFRARARKSDLRNK